jgi:photosynthetic reaction center cytochrome c subunit
LPREVPCHNVKHRMHILYRQSDIDKNYVLEEAAARLDCKGIKTKMNLRLKQIILAIMPMVYLLAIPPVRAQSPAEQTPQMADEVFKNLQVLRGLTVNEFMGTMGFISASLSMNCIDCHVIASASDVARFADDTPVKQTALKMILMVKTINASNFGGKPVVTCYSCHRGTDRPRGVPSLADQYGTPPPEDPDDVEIVGPSEPGAPSAGQILDKYVQALGGPQRLAVVTSFVAKGTYQGFDTSGEKVPVEIFAKAPAQRAVFVHLPDGDSIRTYDGRMAWKTSTGTLLPLPVLVLSGGELDGARLDAALFFPLQIKQSLKDWRAGFPDTTVDDVAVDIVQGTNSENMPVKLYFDKKSGLLLRLMRYSQTVIGVNPTRIDYADYRAVAGVKVPFRWTVTWTDGRSVTELTTVQLNQPIDASKFATPKPAKAVTP